MFGGPVLDAPTVAARLIATFHDAQGNVAIEGLVSNEHAVVDYPEAAFRADSSVLDSVQLAGSGNIADRLWNKPALSIIGMDIPSVAVSSNTLLPSHAFQAQPARWPRARTRRRPRRRCARHIVAQDPFGAQVTFEADEAGQSFATDTSAPAAQASLWALGEAWGVPAVETGIGGSIPFIADLLEVFPAAQILVTGVEDPDSRAHSANESLHLGDFRHAILAEALLLARLNNHGL